MSLRAILSAAAVAAALFPTPGQAEVLHLSYDYAIDGLATVSGAPVMGGFSDLDVFSEPHGGGFEVQSAPIVSPDTVGLDGGTLPVHCRHATFHMDDDASRLRRTRIMTSAGSA
jgi:hypothetical protein